jgi:crotonobetainyl-CoA:carnitine CoA-transferase CaiB-like acyl-CoA transferase
MSGPLDGVRILDLTTVGFGPYGVQILADYGADVIKVEAPEGDITRGIAPMRNPGMGHFYLNANRNKRSIALDLKQPGGRDALLKLVESADALITSIRPAAMERLGLGYDECKSVNSSIVYVALVGFGQDGPYAKRPAYDDVIQGLSGLAAMQGGPDGAPAYVKASICDKICSQFCAHATLAALLCKEKTGKGQLVEVPMLEAMVGFNMVEHNAGHTFVPIEGPTGYARAMAPDRRPYATLDGYVSILPYNTKHWQSFFKLMGKSEMVNDPRVTDPKTRSIKIAELYEMASKAVAFWKTDELLVALQENDIPNGRAMPLDHLANDEHLKAVGIFEEYDHPTEGRIRHARPAVRFSETPQNVRVLPQALGQDTTAILGEAGYTEDALLNLLNTGAAIDGAPSRKAAAE